jgi:hypothetical protein
MVSDVCCSVMNLACRYRAGHVWSVPVLPGKAEVQEQAKDGLSSSSSSSSGGSRDRSSKCNRSTQLCYACFSQLQGA